MECDWTNIITSDCMLTIPAFTSQRHTWFTPPATVPLFMLISWSGNVHCSAAECDGTKINVVRHAPSDGPGH